MTRRRLAYLGTAPQKATEHSAGFDITISEDAVLQPHEVKSVATGLRIAIPEGCFGMLVPRSSTPLRWNVTLANSPGIIDADYRGEVRLLLYNLSAHEVMIPAGARLAQLIIVPYENVELEPFQGTLDEFEDSSKRGNRGFGSSGI